MYFIFENRFYLYKLEERLYTLTNAYDISY